MAAGPIWLEDTADKKQADLAQRYYRQTDRHDQLLKVFFAYPKS
jgi:hypothetical protein